MRIAYICADSGIPLWSEKGAANHVREFVAALEKLGHTPMLFVARTGSGEPTLNIRVCRLRAGEPDSTAPADWAREVQALDRNIVLEKALETEHQRAPFDLVYERYSLWSFSARDFAARYGIPYVLEVNSPLRDEQKLYRRLMLDSASASIQSLLFSTADLVVGVSDEVVDYVRRTPGAAPAIAVPNGVDLSLFDESWFDEDDAQEPARSFTIGFLGSLKPWHGVEILLEAFGDLAEESDDYRLLIVGDGPARAEIKRFTKERGLSPRVSLTGAVPKPEAARLLQRMDVATAPYPLLENFYFSPLKLYEYMAAGRAIAASAIGEIPDILDHGCTGLLVRPGDPNDLAAKIRTLREDASLRRRLGREARREAFDKHGWTGRVEQILTATGLPTHAGHEETAHAAYAN